MLGLTRENMTTAGDWIVGQLTARKAGIVGTVARHTISAMGALGITDVLADQAEGETLLRNLADNLGLLLWSLALVLIPLVWSRITDWLLETKAPPADPVNAAR